MKNNFFLLCAEVKLNGSASCFDGGVSLWSLVNINGERCFGKLVASRKSSITGIFEGVYLFSDTKIYIYGGQGIDSKQRIVIVN